LLFVWKKKSEFFYLLLFPVSFTYLLRKAPIAHIARTFFTSLGGFGGKPDLAFTCLWDSLYFIAFVGVEEQLVCDYVPNGEIHFFFIVEGGGGTAV
jgi:hypothetical protein